MNKIENNEKLSVNFNYSNEILKLPQDDFFKYVENEIFSAIDELGIILEMTAETINSLKEHASANIECESEDPLITYFDAYFWNDFCLYVNFAYHKTSNCGIQEHLAKDSYFGKHNIEEFEEFTSGKHKFFKN